MVSETSRRQHTAPASATAAVGDFTAHPLAMAVPLIDGQAAMLAMCVAFLQARTSIWIADWSIYARLRLVRGQDQRAGPDGSDEQYTLLDRLRAVGLDQDAIALLRADGLCIGRRSGAGGAARRGCACLALGSARPMEPGPPGQ